MATSTYSAPVSDVYGESTALATTLAYGDVLNVRKGFRGLQFFCAADFKFLTTPRIDRVLLYDASEDAYYDFTDAALDNSTTTSVNLGTMTTSDILYVGCVDTFLGLAVDMDATLVNSAAVSTLDWEFWNGSVWTDFSGDDDGTDAASKTLAQDGFYTWTLPTTWNVTPVNGSANLYYARFKPAGTLTANTSINGLCAINKGTSYIYYVANVMHNLNYDEDAVGGLQFLAASATPTVYVNHIKYRG